MHGPPGVPLTQLRLSPSPLCKISTQTNPTGTGTSTVGTPHTKVYSARRCVKLSTWTNCTPSTQPAPHPTVTPLSSLPTSPGSREARTVSYNTVPLQYLRGCLAFPTHHRAHRRPRLQHRYPHSHIRPCSNAPPYHPTRSTTSTSPFRMQHQPHPRRNPTKMYR